MTPETFINQISRIFTAFGQDHDSGTQAGQRQIAQVKEWYDMWIKTYPETTDGMMIMVIDQAIKDCKRIPSFAELKEIRAGLAITSLKAQLTECARCRSLGHLAATREINNCEYTYAFRCNLCTNWKGTADGLPEWKEKYWGEWYKLKGIDYVQL